MERILIVDDEPSILDSLSLILTHQKYSVDTCFNGFKAIEKVKENDYDLVLLDIKMPQMDGLEVLEKIMGINPRLVVVMISGHGNIETAVESTKKGAYYFLEKPFPDIPELMITIRNAINHKKSIDELYKLKNELIELNTIIGSSPIMKSVKDLIVKFASLNLNVLISGESGTGKMLVANQIHLTSDRSDKPFIIVNCATLDDPKANEQIFGVFEGDSVKVKGKLAEAEGGTLLFDEISNMPLDFQSKILKVIEEGSFSRLGQQNEIRINVRFLFSTNKDLEILINENKFREDLYHRINVLKIVIPSLRERAKDIEDLVSYFSEQLCKIYNLKSKKFTQNALSKLKSFRWAGNVRELKNLVERIIFTVDKEVIDEEDIEFPGSRHSKELNDLLNKDLSLNEFQNESEKLFLVKMLKDYKYNISQTAEALNIQRSHLYKLMNKYNIPTPSKIK